MAVKHSTQAEPQLTSLAHQSQTRDITGVTLNCNVKDASQSGSVSICRPILRVVISIPYAKQ